MLEKEKLLLRIKKLSKKIGSVKVYFNKHKTGGNNGMGYYFDKNDKLWKSYVFGQFNFISKKSQNEIDVIKDLYDGVCEEVEAHENPLEKIKKIEPELNTVSIYLNHHSCGPYAIGYFYDSKSKCWMAYRNTERGESMYYEYDCEEEAIVGLYKLARTEYDFQHH